MSGVPFYEVLTLGLFEPSQIIYYFVFNTQTGTCCKNLCNENIRFKLVIKKFFSKENWVHFFWFWFSTRHSVFPQKSQLVFTCSNSTMETPKQCLKSVQS